jgi:hypothetical protein
LVNCRHPILPALVRGQSFRRAPTALALLAALIKSGRPDFFPFYTRSPMRLRALALALALPFVAGCGGDSPTEPQLPITFSGTIQVLNGTTVPANARVLAMWGVSAGSPDYSYVYGTGTVNSNGTFTITFDAEPPAEALNNGEVGVALLILTTDQTLAEGRVPDNYNFSGVIGMTEDHSVIFTKNLTGPRASDWPNRFAGYGAGEVERSTTGFDTFKSVALNALKIVVDNPDNIDPPNWT